MLSEISQERRLGSVVMPAVPFRFALFAFNKNQGLKEKFGEWKLTYTRKNNSYEVYFEGDHKSFFGNIPLGLLNKRSGEFKSIFGLSASAHKKIVKESLSVQKCDQCNTRKARNLYVLYSVKHNKLFYIASGCLKDFFSEYDSSISPNIVNDIVFYVDNHPADIFYRAKDSHAQAVKIDTTMALAAALFLVEKSGKGYISKKQQEYGSTAFDMENILIYENSQSDLDSVRDLLIEAAVLKQCILEETKEEKSEFIGHLRDILSENTITKHSFGLLASAPTFYKKFISYKKLIDSGKLPPGEGYSKGFLGTVGDKIIVHDAYVEEIKKLYNGGYLVVFRNKENKKIIWFTSQVEKVPVVGSACAVRGVVKKHETYNDIDGTVLSRCRVFINAPSSP